MIQTSRICIKRNLPATEKFRSFAVPLQAGFIPFIVPYLMKQDTRCDSLRQFPLCSQYVTVSADNHTSLQVTVQSIRNAHKLQRSPFFELIFH